MRLATVGGSKIEVSGGIVTLVVAVIGLVPPLGSAFIDAFVLSKSARSTSALETRRLDIAQRAEELPLLQAALTSPSAAERKQRIVFLVRTGMLRDDQKVIVEIPEDQIPHWPLTVPIVP